MKKAFLLCLFTIVGEILGDFLLVKIGKNSKTSKTI